MSKRRGFSLIVVLLVSLLGLCVIGAMMQIVSVDSGIGRTASAANRRYNLLVSEVETARSELMAKLASADSIPRRMTAGTITSADMLLVMPEERRVLSPKEQNLYGLKGHICNLTVKIYDMQYDQADVSSSMEPAEISLLPPAMRLVGSGGKSYIKPTDDDDLLQSGEKTVTSVNAGAYLIRAFLEVDGVREGDIDLAVVESGKDS
jgi:hypothetical protein